MYLSELIDEIKEEYPEIDNAVDSHNINNDGSLNILNNYPEIVNRIQNQIRQEYGDTFELYHGSEVELNDDVVWGENTSFTDEFDIEFSGEDGYIIVAQVPVERIKFYLEEESEFVITGGALDCEVYTVAEYFGL